MRDAERPRHHPRRVPQRLGHQRPGPDRRADRGDRGDPGRARPGGLVDRLTDRKDQHRGRLRRPPRPGRPGPGRRAAPRRPVHPDLLLLPAPRPGAGAPPRRGAPTDGRPRRAGRAHRHRAAAREREGHLRRRPAARPRHRRVGRLARAAAGLGPRQLRAGRASPRSPTATRSCARTPSTSRSRTRCWPPARSCPRARATARSARPSARWPPTASTASSPWSRTSGTYNEFGALSGAANFTRATRAFTAILDSEGITYS